MPVLCSSMWDASRASSRRPAGTHEWAHSPRRSRRPVNIAQQLRRGHPQPIGDACQHAHSGIALSALHASDVGQGQSGEVGHVLLGESAAGADRLQVVRQLGNGIVRHLPEHAHMRLIGSRANKLYTPGYVMTSNASTAPASPSTSHATHKPAGPNRCRPSTHEDQVEGV